MDGSFGGVVGLCVFGSRSRLGAGAVFSLYIVWCALGDGTGILFPFTFGLAIDLGSWLITSGFVLFVSVVLLIFTFVIKFEMQDDRRMNIRGYFREMRQNNFLRPTILLYLTAVIHGFVFIMPMVMTMLIIMVYGTNIGLGILVSVFGFVSILTLLTYKKVKPLRPTLFWVSAFVPLAASLVLFFYIGAWSIILFNAALVFRNMAEVEYHDVRINLAKYWGGNAFLMESHLFVEGAMWIGRVLACGLLLLTAVFNYQIMLPIVVTFIATTHAIVATSVFFWRRRFI